MTPNRSGRSGFKSQTALRLHCGVIPLLWSSVLFLHDAILVISTEEISRREPNTESEGSESFHPAGLSARQLLERRKGGWGEVNVLKRTEHRFRCAAPASRPWNRNYSLHCSQSPSNLKNWFSFPNNSSLTSTRSNIFNYLSSPGTVCYPY